MSELTDEIKSRVINSIRASANGSTPVNIKDLDKFMLEAVKHLGKSGEGVGISQTQGGGASITLIITGLKVSVDIMQRIARRYFTRQRRYLDEQIIHSSHYEGAKRTATGQTRGRMSGQSLTGNMEVRDNFFHFHMPDAIRSGDVTAHKNKVKEMAEKRKRILQNRINDRVDRAIRNNWELPVEQKQRGPNQGKPYTAFMVKERKSNWKPATYNEVAGYIEKRVGKPIFFSGEQEIKEMIVTELIKAMR